MSLNAQDIQQLLQDELQGCEIMVEGGGGKFQVVATGEVFEGLNAVKRQQLIYQYLNPHIQSGAVHAVSMLLRTHDEAQS